MKSGEWLLRTDPRSAGKALREENIVMCVECAAVRRTSRTDHCQSLFRSAVWTVLRMRFGAFCLILGWWLLSPALADEAALLRLIPESANAVSIVRVGRIMQSERARKERWTEDRDAFLAGAADVPAWVDTIVLGSLVHPSVPEEVWTVVATDLPSGAGLLELADASDHVVERFSGLPAVHTRRGNLAIEFPGRSVAALLPSHRQDVSRWVRAALERKSAVLTPCLQAAAQTEGHIVLALDVEDMLDTRRAEERLSAHPDLRDQAQGLPAMIQALRTLRCVRLNATVTTVTQARVTLEFTQPVAIAAPLVRSMLTAALNDAGIGLEAFDNAEAVASGSSVVLSTELPDDQLRMLLSLVLAPRTIPERPLVQSRETEKKPPVPAPTDVKPRVSAPDATSSLRYFNVVSRAIDDLHRSSSRGTNPTRTATWHDNFATKIEELSTDGVDPELVAFGRTVVARFRALAASLRGTAIEVDTQQRSVTYDVHYDPGWASVGFWGQMGYQAPSVNVSSNLAEVRQRQAEAVSRWGHQREQVWSLILSDRSRIRQQMSDRYGKKF